MKRAVICIILCLSFLDFAAKAELTLKEIAFGVYSPKSIRAIQALQDGESYAQISSDYQRIERYSFKTGKLLSSLFDLNTARGATFKYIEGYILSPDESKILIQTKTKSIYRHSFTAEYYIYSVANRTLTPLSTQGPQQQPKFSPDGNYIAFVRDNNLFLIKLLFDNSESQVTTDGKQNEIINGLPDWVNEEEFSSSSAFEFSADSKMLAWVRYDESKVPLYSFPLYHFPKSKESVASLPTAYAYKYPLAGGTNATVSVHSFDIKANVTRKLALPLTEDSYVPRILPTAIPDQFVVFTLNRKQNCLDAYLTNARSTLAKLIFREEAKEYISETTYTQAQTNGENLFLLSDKSGFNQLYLYSLRGGNAKVLTNQKQGVKSFYLYSPQTKNVYYEAYDESPLRTAVFSSDLSGKTTKLTTQKGTNTAIFSKTGAYFIHTFSNITTPPIYTLRQTAGQGKLIQTLLTNDEITKQLENKLGIKELFTFTTPENTTLNGWIIKPLDFNPNNNYPVIMYQYSGPGSQEVLDSWRIGFYGGGLLESYWASQGFIVVCVDGRGTGGRGASFEKSTYLHLGLLESKDQVYTAQYLGNLPYIDKDRIAIWGWSFGGFNTLMSMSDGQNVFKAGVAVAAPSTWKFYDTIYTERFMRTPKENEEGYQDNPLTRASKLSGNLLLIHGTADDNVHFSNATVYAEALVQANKQFDMQVYTNKNHSIYGGNTRYQLLTRITNFWLEKLK